jgi:hypothetical protein
VGEYYYAGGRRVAIESDVIHVAVDRQLARAAGLGAAVDGLLPRRATSLPGDVLLAERASIDERELAHLREAGALRPVYRREASVMVPLPEIRVELDDPAQRAAVLAAVATAPFRVEIVEDAQDRLVLVPRSGSSEHALAVANFIYERARPAAAAVRFVQVVPRPSRRKR